MKRLKLFFMAMVMLFAVQICTVSVTCETHAATTTATVRRKPVSTEKKENITTTPRAERSETNGRP